MAEPRKSMEPWLKDEVEYYHHQVEGIRQMMRMRNFLLSDEMGLGKSLQAITVAIGDVMRGWAERILVVAPATLKGNWQDEFEKFTRVPATILGQEPHPTKPDHIRKLSPRGRSDQIAKFAADTGPRALIVNYEQVNAHIAEINQVQFDIAIFDEAHYLKSPRAQRTKVGHQIRASRNFMLTGTPMPNGRADELWGLFHMIDRSAYPKYWSFRNRYCVFGGYKDKQIIGTKNEKELTEALAKFQIRRLKKDVLDLPEIQFVPRKTYLSDKQQKLYDKVENELEIDLVGEPSPAQIEHAMVKVMRMKQICGTLLPFTGEDESSKLDLAQEDAIEIMTNGHKVVAFTQYRDVLASYANRLDKLASQFDIWELHGDIPIHDRTKIVKEWASDSKPGIIICMLQIAGIGLNMTASRHLQMIDKLWTPAMNKQAIDRVHRIGASETQPVQVYEYLCRNTVETRVESVLKSKEKATEQIIDDANFRKQLLQAIMRKDAGK